MILQQLCRCLTLQTNCSLGQKTYLWRTLNISIHTNLRPLKQTEIIFTIHNYESKNNKIPGIERDLKRSLNPTPLLKQGCTSRIFQTGLEHLQRRRLHNLSWQSVPVHGHPYCKKCSSAYFCETLYIPVIGYCSLSYCWKESGLVWLPPELKIFINIDQIPS